jgi:hypothetical protein
MPKSRKPWKLRGQLSSAAEVREFVFRRDGGCMAVAFEDFAKAPDVERHVCGSAFSPTMGGGMTLEHVTLVHHPTLDGRHNDERHTVTLCGTLNGESFTLAHHDMKEFFRDYLRALYPVCEPPPG